MKESKLFLISDDTDLISKATQFWEMCSMKIQIFSTEQWNSKLLDPSFSRHLLIDKPESLSQVDVQNEGAKVLPFPSHEDRMTKVATMDEVEKHAIESAISECRGNLTEAAKALGIGRATLYRKVKIYNIDTDMARSKKLAV